MGLRATVIKKYEIEYGNANGFNYDNYTLANIIGCFCDDYFCGEDCNTDSIWEIDKEEFKEMVDRIKNLSDEEFDSYMESWFDGVFSDDKPYSKKYVLDVFEGWLEETPENSNYVRIAWL